MLPCYTDRVVEFKKTNRHGRRQSRLHVPQRGGFARPVLWSQPSDKTDTIHATKPSSSKALLRQKLAFMPHWTRLSFTKRTIVTTMAIAGCLVVGLLIHNSISAATKPNYQTVLPGGKPVGSLGGWKRVSPPGNDPVFAYADTIDTVPVSVSQQPLPQSFRSDTSSQVAELARRFNATDKIDAGNTVVYVGTSAKGPQSAILTKDNLLILIKSETKVNNASWARYAESLK
jgi:hypothetical protein